jgi:hypothetical protein
MARKSAHWNGFRWAWSVKIYDRTLHLFSQVHVDADFALGRTVATMLRACIRLYTRLHDLQSPFAHDKREEHHTLGKPSHYQQTSCYSPYQSDIFGVVLSGHVENRAIVRDDSGQLANPFPYLVIACCAVKIYLD